MAEHKRRTSSVVVEVLDGDGVVVNGEDGAADVVVEVGQLAYLDGLAEDGAHTYRQYTEDLHVNYLKCSNKLNYQLGRC